MYIRYADLFVRQMLWSDCCCTARQTQYTHLCVCVGLGRHPAVVLLRAGAAGQPNAIMAVQVAAQVRL